jgi:hypothetical protein
MVILGVFCLALGMLVHLLNEQVEEDDHAARTCCPVRIRSKNPCVGARIATAAKNHMP